ncbi:RNA polymerase sigma factor [Oceanicola sp. S124]|uniref:RNA polymerase sigma factor n=1 Tax=Oceanicola sp. S124 TaxID=1042378 RepID=UPI0002557A1D|nr:RNA polymerase sigma factor [Oceanicola sp. S124]
MRQQDAKRDLLRTYLRDWHVLRIKLAGRFGSHDLAEEAMQETWLRLDRSGAPAAGIANPHAYVLTVAGNIATDLLRRERRHGAGQLRDDARLERLIDSAPIAEEVLIARDELRMLVRALMALPHKARAVLLMNRCLDMTHRQIAEALGLSESMVAKYMGQALRHCRDYRRGQP